MRFRTAIVCLTGAVLTAALAGCSFSASASAGSRASIVGKEKVMVSADQPAPKAPEPTVDRKAKVVGKKIEITEKIMFDYNKATIKPESHDLLNDVAAVIKENDFIKKVRIDGHTDSDGTDKYNKKLSEERAASVRDYLIAAGVEGERLMSKGYGEEKPIADNDTPEGKEKNRRVEFHIIAKSAQGGH